MSNFYSKIIKDYGESFYLLDSKQFETNFFELKKEFISIYENFNIAYSYKTNYIPKLCRIINNCGGYAEVVSEMELELALKLGIEYSKIIWNGPIKNTEYLKKYINTGILINIDNIEELNFIKNIVKNSKETQLRLGLRCNYDVCDDVISRFGFDVEGEDFKEAILFLKENDIKLTSLQCHFAKRDIKYWNNKVEGLIKTIDRYKLNPEIIDVGGGLYGKMHNDLKKQFNSEIPSYLDYAKVIASIVNDYYYDKDNKPLLLIEPGSALVGDCMKFISTIKSIKKIRGKYYAATLGSQKNISMTSVNPPINIIHMGGEKKEYKNLDFVGFTCIESDVLYRNYSGDLAIGDLLEISNCGSYSVVMKPPFILPNFPIVDISNNNIELIKRAETFEDIFNTYIM